MRPIIRLSLLGCLVSLLSPTLASADENGAKGKIVEVTVNEPTSDEFPKFHGSVLVRGDNKVNTTYHWGGSFCPGQTLSADSVGRLVTAFVTRTKITVHFKNGQGTNKCVVGYELEIKGGDGPD